MSRDSAVRLAVLLPDVLGTYSDRGNVTVLAQRLRWRGVDAEVVEALAAEAPPTDCDVYVIGGGEDSAQAYAARWLIGHPRLLTALRTRQVLAVCAGLQILGRWLQAPDGQRIEGAGLLDLTTVPGRRRAVGEVVSDCTEPGVATLTGFENHQGRTSLGPGIPALGRVRFGIGNGDGTDGVLTGTAVGTYLHGPVLARNPDLADLLLRRATGLPPVPAAGQRGRTRSAGSTWMATPAVASGEVGIRGRGRRRRRMPGQPPPTPTGAPRERLAGRADRGGRCGR